MRNTQLFESANGAQTVGKKRSPIASFTGATANGSVIAAEAGMRLAVVSVEASLTAAGTLVFQSNNTAISPVFQLAAAGNIILGSPDNNMPLFTVNKGEALKITSTGTNNASIQVTYAPIP